MDDDRRSMTGESRDSITGGVGATTRLRRTTGQHPSIGTLRPICSYPGCSDPAEFPSDYCDDHPGGVTPDFDLTPTRLGSPTTGIGKSDDEIEQLRRDISRLEGKVDALLRALEVTDGDE